MAAALGGSTNDTRPQDEAPDDDTKGEGTWHITASEILT
jgi:hypothetical protein